MTNGLRDLVQVLSHGLDKGTDEQTRTAIDAVFRDRYPAKFRSPEMMRVALMNGEGNVPFAGLLNSENPTSGVYGGMSLIWFPVAKDDEGEAASLLTFVCGTRGLAPDEQILGRPGHARHLLALSRHLKEATGVPVWVKRDPTNLAQPLPDVIRRQHPRFENVFQRYGACLYAIVEVPKDERQATQIVQGFLDFYGWERGWPPRAAVQNDVNDLKNSLRAHLFPRTSAKEVVELLRERRFVILQGPPGTGKTRLAVKVLEEAFKGRGNVVQFHPAVTYETFVAGIAPDVSQQSLRFQVRSGWLADAVQKAEGGEHLLVVDEINRADLGKVLGEAICLFESAEISAGHGRIVRLPQPLENGRQELSVPKGFFLLGTMNSADRSIAILDLAVRRRFAFVDVWPDLAVVQAQGIRLATDAYGQLLDIFSQYAPGDALSLIPGHAYFLANDEAQLSRRLRFELLPLLNEYLQEGRLGPCESELQAYCDWLEGAIPEHG